MPPQPTLYDILAQAVQPGVPQGGPPSALPAVPPTAPVPGGPEPLKVMPAQGLPTIPWAGSQLDPYLQARLNQDAQAGLAPPEKLGVMPSVSPPATPPLAVQPPQGTPGVPAQPPLFQSIATPQGQGYGPMGAPPSLAVGTPPQPPGGQTAPAQPQSPVAGQPGVPMSQPEQAGMLQATGPQFNPATQPLQSAQAPGSLTSGTALNGMNYSPDLRGAMMGPNATTSAGGAPVGSQASAMIELARQLAMASGPVGGVADQMQQTLPQAMGQMNNWSRLGLDTTAQQNLHQYQMGNLGVAQSAEQRLNQAEQLEQAKAVFGASPQQQRQQLRMKMIEGGMDPARAEAILDRMTPSPGFQLPQNLAAGTPGVGQPQTGSSAGLPQTGSTVPTPATPAGQVSQGQLPTALPDLPPPGLGHIVDPMLGIGVNGQRAPGAKQEPIENIMNAVVRASGPGGPTPNDLSQVVNYIALKHDGGMQGIKDWAAPKGALHGTAEKFRSGWSRLGGGAAVSESDANAAAVRNSMGWQHTTNSPLESVIAFPATHNPLGLLANQFMQ